LFRILAYRLQADRLGDLDSKTLRLLERSGSPADVGRLAAEFNKRRKLVADAVAVETVSTVKFPANREKNGIMAQAP
jgi:hypothetical protein